MSKGVLKKIKHEFGFLVVLLAISLGISAAMVLDGARALGIIREVYPFVAFVKLSEFIVGLFWLFLTLKIFHECITIKRKYPSIFFIKYWEKENLSGLLRDLIAFYRGYFQEIRIILVITVLVGLSMIASTIYLICLNLITIEEFYFHLFIGIATLVFSLNALIFVEKKWGKKLLKAKSEEKIFEDLLGEVD